MWKKKLLVQKWIKENKLNINSTDHTGQFLGEY